MHKNVQTKLHTNYAGIVPYHLHQHVIPSDPSRAGLMISTCIILPSLVVHRGYSGVLPLQPFGEKKHPSYGAQYALAWRLSHQFRLKLRISIPKIYRNLSEQPSFGHPIFMTMKHCFTTHRTHISPIPPCTQGM